MEECQLFLQYLKEILEISRNKKPAGCWYEERLNGYRDRTEKRNSIKKEREENGFS